MMLSDDQQTLINSRLDSYESRIIDSQVFAMV